MNVARNNQISNSGLHGGNFRKLPAGIWILGFVSMFMDISSELIHSLLPVFMVSVLGASMTTIGVIEGVAEAAAAFTRIFSGMLSDYFRKRKLLAAAGYGLSALTKPLFPLAASITWVFAGRFLDRIGKGIRGAPRDALVAELVPGNLRGAAFGLRQALDSAGAFIGPLFAVLFMFLFADKIRSVLWIAVIPATLAFFLLLFGVHDPEDGRASGTKTPAISMERIRQLPRRFTAVVVLGGIFTLARFSEAFLLLRGSGTGLEPVYIPLVMIAMNLVYTISAYPAGSAADRGRQHHLLVTGLIALLTSDVILALATRPWHVFAGAAMWGLHLGLTQGLFSKLVADSTTSAIRGTAFGIFNFVSGGALLLASILAGSLWSAYGAPFTFFAGAFLVLVCLAGLLFYRKLPSILH